MSLERYTEDGPGGEADGAGPDGIVSRILGDVVHQQGLALFSDPTGNTLPHLEAVLAQLLRTRMQGCGKLQLHARFVDEEHGACFGIKDLCDAPRGHGEYLL